MKKYCFFLFVLAFVACTNERDPMTSVDDSSLERFKDLKVFSPDTTLTAMDLVRKVAIDFSKRNSAVTRSGSAPAYSLYMTWGEGGSNDGYFSYNSWSYPCDYVYNRKAIVNIYH